ncbi:multifunctional oxoglutarate decarboxylase/oxoglutarate dehydrogenase thiamine pyrophosphate-binding subunit/dihydrolipoyllysine-residue succinyltransferase subunit [Saxibacter everestensis]|uniref:Multifunctional oxoglutarate decarboxylase/oxoglutarate dehydrogenase thiamine pyrophosphate-binding subunit/dihydrolipoyllysine-residue succinyltransferase subunit n=2 Tax=Saxibacter everestensis TaxID=2909229 RepID=A0ABY8QYG6_9MICO|nr:multifunctional oxoglutarate decarboxylase/oxoglutarate dehydrogenase thiamine pyrophosphate-binding subunit/dihydrolipoyllysine-residue succinyltransferase subunit [Brevibacteriaceae bacterium ZFBP1038]
MGDFGANEWLVDEMYERFKEDKNSVDEAWWEFFEDYTPEESATNGTPDRSSGSTAKPVTAETAAKAEAKPEAKPAAKTEVKPETKPAAPKAEEKPKAETEAKPAEAKPAARTDAKPAAAKPAKAEAADEAPDKITPLRGPAKLLASNMDSSLEVPTATSVRAVPAKLLIDNRIVINSHLRRSQGGKVSFTHLIGFAVIRALSKFPSQNVYYDIIDGKPSMVAPAHVNFGLAIDIPKKDGTRALLVPNVKKAEELDFAQFWGAYEDLVKKARNGQLTAGDFAGTTVSLTNPGGIGTVHSVPRLTKKQGCIVGVGALDYPAEFQGASLETVTRLGISKVLTLTSTYDHRVIQGAGSGEFLRLVHEFLLGGDGFYDEIFRSLRLPYEPVRWVNDIHVDPEDEINKTARVQELIDSYRTRGHLMADTDPLEYRQRRHPDLDVQTHGLTLWDLDREFPTGGFANQPQMSLRKILGVLRDSYCRTTGIEYMHISDPVQRKWFQNRVEKPFDKPSRDEQMHILGRLNAAEAFETFLQTKYVGQKRFSLEGGESTIALLDQVLANAADAGLPEVTIGMAHRGRLNVLANIAGKSYGQIFREFEGTQDPRSVQGSGDVKYHLGTEGSYTSAAGNSMKVYVAANPSHLETVDPVLEGIARAKQDRIDLGGAAFPVLPVLVHGDAAFAGQGVVTETLNLSELRGYRTGGTIHVVINNQVGFTTSPSSSRSSFYSTDAAKIINAPIIHVNGDDPEAVVRAARLAFEYRQEFAKDVVIDLVCYRRRGHNEGDDPSMTQPMMYELIDAKRSVRKLYTRALIGRGDISEAEAEEALKDYQARLEAAFAETHDAQTSSVPIVSDDDAPVSGLERPEAQRGEDDQPQSVETAVDSSVIERIGKAHVSPPEGFTVHKKLKSLLEKRDLMSRQGSIDWGYGELLAFGSLLVEGVPVRLTGQDSRRGTFVQRHSVLIDHGNGNEWTPLSNLSDDQARFWVYDSSLSEYAAMGFEYGYSVERPDALVLWEAQFGDFGPGAQSIIDEFISSAEQKWQQNSSVVLLLPHGYEGQGPDHSSARIERYLQLCAENNMTVAQPSTPASHFHLLRRQAYSRPRRPLIVFTPKWMLRLKAASSPVEDFTTGGFQPVIPDTSVEPQNVDRVLLVSGKLYWQLLEAREKAGDTRTALVRFEQLYPLCGESIAKALDVYGDAELVWVQDEPENQGPWPSIALGLPKYLGGRSLRVVSRRASASPATGLKKVHDMEQAALIKTAFER